MAGEQAVSILKGEADSGEMPVGYLLAEDGELTINKDTAEELGITIPEEFQYGVK